MSHLPYHEEQLEFVLNLASHRPEFLTPFFRFLNYFDSPYFFFVLIPFVWVGFSYQWGLRIFYWFNLNQLVINFIKNWVGWPRPSTDIPEVGLFHPASFGFPSGGAQGCMLLGCLLIYYGKSRAAWALGLTYILLISFSRLYLGVHYPIDILGGWFFGFLLFLLFVFSKEPLEKWLEKKGLRFSLLLGLFIPLLIMASFPIPTIFYSMGSVIGVSVGTYFSLKHHFFLPQPATLNEGLSRAAFAILCLFLLISCFSSSPTFLKSFIPALFMSLAVSPICRKLLLRF